MSSASGLQASDFSPLNSCLSNGFTSRGWTCGFKVMALKPLFSVKLYWDAILTPDNPSCLPSAPFHPLVPPAWGSLQQLAKLLSSPISTNAVFSCVHPHSDCQLLASPVLTLHPASPPHRKKEKTKQVWFNYPKTLFPKWKAFRNNSYTAGEDSFSNPFHWWGATGILLGHYASFWRAEGFGGGLVDTRAHLFQCYAIYLVICLYFPLNAFLTLLYPGAGPLTGTGTPWHWCCFLCYDVGAEPHF